MKKNLLYVALATVAFASCSDDVVVDEVVSAAKSPIAFNMYAAGNTRAVTEETAATLATNGFKACAVYTDAESAVSDYFTNIDATAAKKTLSGATHGTNYYWPVAGKMSFYAANQEITINSSTHAATIVYTADTQKDLVAATKADVACPQTTPVAINFAHLKNQILFSAKLNKDDATLTAKVTKITIAYPTGGTYTYSTNAWTNNTTLADAPATYYSGTAVAFTGGENYAAVSDAGALALVPTATPLTVTIDYTVEQTIGGVATIVADYTGDDAKTVNVTANSMGKKIRYNLSLPFGVNPIEFTATVTAWETATATEVTVTE